MDLYTKQLEMRRRLADRWGDDTLDGQLEPGDTSRREGVCPRCGSTHK
jgi:hypothetical protein